MWTLFSKDKKIHGHIFLLCSVWSTDRKHGGKGKTEKWKEDEMTLFQNGNWCLLYSWLAAVKMQNLKWQSAGWRARSLPRRNTHGGQLQACGRSLGKVTNSHTPLLQRCQQSLISLCLHEHSLSGPERKVATSPVVFWIAPEPSETQSAATAGIQQLWLLPWKFGFV